MGCSQSKIDEEEAVIRCKDRKKFMKDAVVARNAFAAAHSAYAMSLKNTGAALSDYAQGEVQNPTQLGHASSASAAVGAPQPPFVVVDSLPPPPPPPEADSGYTPVPLQRAQSMPEIKMPPKSKQSETMSSTIVEEDEEGEEMEGSEGLVRRKPRDRRAGGSSRGGGGSRREVVEERAPPPAATAASQWHDSAFADFIFPPEGSVPGTSLGEVEELRMEKEEIERKMYEERKLYDEEPKKVEEEVEKREEVVVEEKVPPVEAEKVAEKEKAVVGAGKGGKKAGKVGAGVGEKRAAKGGVNLVQIFADLDDHFLKASESAHDVSKMLEATRLHYHSNFADNRGHINHSERVMRVITWNRSFRGVSNPDDGKDDFDSEEHETHATVLDKLLAWEKKLYDEVKAGELMKIEYQRKVATLNKLKKRGTNSEALEKAKATVSQLHTRYIVDMQSMDSTVSEINRLRDKQLYPKLVQLVNAMATMWDTMRVHNESQSRIVTDLRGLDLSQSPKETSDHHHDRTEQLWNVVRDWHMQFCKLVDFQREYIKSLSNWLKLNLIPIESSLKEKVSSPQRIENPPIQRLLIAWQDNLQKLRDEDARTAINNFAAVIETIMHHQADELRLREKCEESRRELSKKKRQFEDWYNKYMQRRTPDETDLDHASDQGNNEAVVERQMVVEMVKKRLEEEEEAYQRLCIQVREKSLASLKSRLPELFRAMSEVSSACAHMYSVLRSVSQPKN